MTYNSEVCPYCTKVILMGVARRWTSRGSWHWECYKMKYGDPVKEIEKAMKNFEFSLQELRNKK